MKTLLLILSLLACVTSTAPAAPIVAPSKISAVTVYADRAVVTRTASVDLGSGVFEVSFENLPANLAQQSLQVSGKGSAQVSILDVTTRAAYVSFTPNERVRMLEDQLLVLSKQRRVLEDRMKTLKLQEASLTRIENAATQPPSKEAPRLSLDEAAKLLVFLEEQRGKIAGEQQSLDAQAQELTLKQTALEQQLAQLRGAGGRSFQTVIVRLDAANAGQLNLSLSYAVPGANWVPAYDARVLSTARTVQLNYFGVVRQNTGEDWTNVALTLSTARPSLGGTPPALVPWVLDIYRPRPVTMAAPAAPMAMRREMKMKDGAEEDVVQLEAMAVVGKVAEYAPAQMQEQATSASFKIVASATVPSDNTPQKVAVTTTRLDTLPEYLAIPKQLAAAFLNAKVSNTSDFPLLGGAMNVFLDETFVAVSSLATIMPGEKFDLALGADEGISVKRKLNNRFTEDTGLVNRGKRVTYDVTITVQNNKKTAEKIVVLDQLPVSRNEKVVVRVSTPEEKQVKADPEGTLKWTLELKPGEKRDLPLKFSVDYPNEVSVTGV